MPWHVEKGGGTCSADEWAVIKDADGSTAGCHPTQAAAQAQLAALYASKKTYDAILQAARLRTEASREYPGPQVRAAPPMGAARLLPFPSRLEVREPVKRGGQELAHIHGTATAYEQLYEMWDAYGPYKEGVRIAAGADSLAADPDVAFLVNHRGMTMARTTNGTLELGELDTGLDYDAYVNAKRSDVRDFLTAVEDRLITESSFAFRIEEGEWNDDYTEYWIKRYNIDRGDVSGVNYGANPYTSVAARTREIMADLAYLPAGAVRPAIERLQGREDVAAVAPPTPAPQIEPGGMSLELARALFDQ